MLGVLLPGCEIIGCRKILWVSVLAPGCNRGLKSNQALAYDGLSSSVVAGPLPFAGTGGFFAAEPAGSSSSFGISFSI
jgi:hypothetical protein